MKIKQVILPNLSLQVVPPSVDFSKIVNNTKHIPGECILHFVTFMPHTKSFPVWVKNMYSITKNGLGGFYVKKRFLE